MSKFQYILRAAQALAGESGSVKECGEVLLKDLDAGKYAEVGTLFDQIIDVESISSVLEQKGIFPTQHTDHSAAPDLVTVEELGKSILGPWDMDVDQGAVDDMRSMGHTVAAATNVDLEFPNKAFEKMLSALGEGIQKMAAEKLAEHREHHYPELSQAPCKKKGKRR